jgi:hypothetical protein
MNVEPHWKQGGMNLLTETLVAAFRDRVAADQHLSKRDLVSLIRTSVRLAAHRVPYAQIGQGESRMGGIPDVPPKFEWPRWAPENPCNHKFGVPWRRTNPTPLGFIAQIDLSEIPHGYRDH